MTFAEKKNTVLDFLKGKNIGQWTTETEIENEFEKTINHVEIRSILPQLVTDKHVDYSRIGCNYKITHDGRRFSVNGGYN